MTAQRGDYDAPVPDVAGQLDELERLHAAATPGPWQVDDDGEECAVTAGTARGLPGSWRATDRIYTVDVGEWSGETEGESSQRAADAALIVAAVNALPRLVGAVRRVEALAAQLDTEARTRPDGWVLAGIARRIREATESQRCDSDRLSAPRSDEQGSSGVPRNPPSGQRGSQGESGRNRGDVVMGVSIYPGGAQWAYSGFMRFRERLAEAEGINLREMEGFGGERSWELPNGSPVTTLAPLLNHSDCEGYLAGYDCASVLPRLRFIVASWRPDGSWDYDTEQAAKLIEGMEHCAEHRCALVFS